MIGALAAITSNATVLSAVRLIADDDNGGESKKSGPIGLAVILALCVASYFLFKSMSRHLRNVREKAAAEIAAIEAAAAPHDPPPVASAESGDTSEPEKAPPL